MPLGSKNKSLKLEPPKEQIKKKIMSGITLKRIAEDYDVSQQTMCTFVSHNKLKPLKSPEPGKAMNSYSLASENAIYIISRVQENNKF